MMPKIQEILEDPVDEDRRELIKWSFAALSGGSFVTGGGRIGAAQLNTDNAGYNGISQEVEDRHINGLFEELYGDNSYSPSILDRNRPNYWIDSIVLDEEYYIPEEVIRKLEEVYDSAPGGGINLMVGQRTVEDGNYSGDAAKMFGKVGGYNDFFDEIHPFIRENAVQVVRGPGLRGHEDIVDGALKFSEGFDDEVCTGNCGGDQPVLGIYRGSEVLLADDDAFKHFYGDSLEALTRVLNHELGHTYGLPHVDDPKDVMYGEGVKADASIGFNPEHWEMILNSS